MKPKIFAIFTVLALTCAFAFSACEKKPPVNPEPTYSDMTSEEIISLYNHVTDFDEYFSKKGFAINLSANVVSDGKTIDAIADIKADARDSGNVLISANVDLTFSSPKQPSSSGGTSTMSVAASPVFETTKVKYGAFVDSSMLYASKTQDEKTVYGKAGLPSSSVMSGNINSRDNVFTLIKTVMSDINFDISEYSSYITGSCCEDEGHYLIDVKYPGGEIEGVEVEAFELNLDMISDGYTASSLDMTLRASGKTISGKMTVGEVQLNTLTESEKAKYDGELLNDFTGGENADFYGLWVGANCEINISADSVTAKIDGTQGSYTFTRLGKYALLKGDKVYVLHLNKTIMNVTDGFNTYEVGKAV